ncbi:unnamed protein product [Caenorhabditis angaria]|uniref:WW domain-containing protein n=1 Tax=Caenorhabditis angaria TaxID=860376 RepID=A0A9P1IXX4_9PELO|nr:unnamed protein product [Caenorhabditis angaria]
MASRTKINKKIMITQYQDPDQSIKELIRPEKKYEKNPNPKKPPQHTQLPSSFIHQKRPRGSSAGHSPQGSMDEFASSSRTIPSPALGMMPQQVFHKRQISAPELHPDYTIERTPAPMNHQPFVSNQHSKSVSALPPVEYPPQPHHVKSVSHEPNYSYGGFPTTPSVQLFSTSHREKSLSLDPMRRTFLSQEIAQPQLPPGWEECYDSEGNRYFKDHNTKSTTWSDPRSISSEHILSDNLGQSYSNYYETGNSSRSMPAIHQHPQLIGADPSQYGSQPQTDYIQQLQNERMMIQEKNMQLMQSGLLDSPQQQQYQAISPMSMHHSQNDSNYMLQQGSQQQQSTTPQPQSQNPQNQAQNQYSNRLVSNDIAMEIDYSHTPTHHQRAHNMPYGLDFSGDLNPREFDQYLQISDGNNRNESMVHYQ